MPLANPFIEDLEPDPRDEELVARAREGDRAALEALLRRHQAWVYNIALRMLWEPNDAEDATQEIMLKVITRLATFEGRSQFRTWLYRIVTNHVLNMRQGSMEPAQLKFADYGRQLDEAPELSLPDPKTVPVEVPVLIEEAKLGCTRGMLLCLDRRQRLAYILGEIFALPARAGAEVMEITTENFRQILSRARRDLHAFMNDKCGLVDQANPCRCAKKTQAFMTKGYVDPDRLRFARPHASKVNAIAAAANDALESMATAIHRDQPFDEPEDQARLLHDLLARSAHLLDP